jgi:hypothetical protein
MLNIIKDIEKKYDVAKVRVGRFQVWPFLRWQYFSYYMNSYAEKGSSRELTIWKKIYLLRNIFYGFKNWFSQYDIIIFSNTSELKTIDGNYINKLIDPLFAMLTEQKILYIEVPVPYHYPMHSLAFKKIVSITPLKFLKKLAQLIFFKKDRINNKVILDKIKSNYHLKLNDNALINSFLREYVVYKLLFRFMKPKVIFTTDYGFIAVIKAANDLGIKSIEIQHGTIGETNLAYHSDIPLDASFYPDYLLVFGYHDYKSLQRSSIYKKSTIIPIGSYYIDFVNSSDLQIDKLNKLKSNYAKSVGVTLQWTVEDKVILFITKAAKLDDQILYVLIPRLRDQTDFSQYTFPRNIIVYKDNDFYKTIKNLDFHSTVYSTCALEAPSLGVQNILIDIEGLAKKHFAEVMKDSDSTMFVQTPEEFVYVIRTFKKIEHELLREKNADVFVPDYLNNLTAFLKKIELL